jgi:hypothetical protein
MAQKAQENRRRPNCLQHIKTKTGR